MRRVALSMVGYAILTVLFSTLLALELCFIAGVVTGVAGIVVLVREPMPPGEVAMNLWRVVMVAIFGLMALVSVAGAVMLPYFSVTGWKSAPRRSAGPEVSAR